MMHGQGVSGNWEEGIISLSNPILFIFICNVQVVHMGQMGEAKSSQ